MASKCDILFGEDFLDKTAAFETYRDAFSIIECDDGTAEVNGIVWFSKAESHLSRAVDALPLGSRSGKGPVLEESSEQSKERDMHGIKNRIDRLFRRKIEIDHSELAATVSKSSADLNDLDARELHRREVTQQYISDLPVEARESEIAKENERIRSYEQSRAELIARDPKSEKFLCDYPGCLAKPFDNQNLLNTHAIIHSLFFNQPYAHDQPPRDSQNKKPTPPSAESRLSPGSFSTAHSTRPQRLDTDRSRPICQSLSGMAEGSSLRAIQQEPLLDVRFPNETAPQGINRPPFSLSNGTVNSPSMNSIAPEPTHYSSPETRMNGHFHQPYASGQPALAYSDASSGDSQNEESTPQSARSHWSPNNFSTAWI